MGARKSWALIVAVVLSDHDLKVIYVWRRRLCDMSATLSTVSSSEMTMYLAAGHRRAPPSSRCLYLCRSRRR